MTCRHVETVIDTCKVERIAELTGSGVSRVIAELKAGGASLRTCNAYLRSVKSFTRWLLVEKRAVDDPLAGLAALNEATDRRRVRRELSDDETNWLLQVTAGNTRPEHGLTGPNRAMLYRLALETGFRASELRSLKVESFALDADPPTVNVAAAYSKRRRDDAQPIRPELAAMLRRWLEGFEAGSAVFAGMPGDAARMLRVDLKRAREHWIAAGSTDAERLAREQSAFLAYRDEAGDVCDFHSLRHTFISRIVAGGASVKVAKIWLDTRRRCSPSADTPIRDCMTSATRSTDCRR